ncbi:GNAT family N-acetyltransferase [Bosea vaviloviae]|uniref:GNAT family N-acetyltransferase n=1 Tax=Bosea vaviloviae TaxID=1526658 RepID=A0A1D7TXS8_9HYPH|nr:GNAT family N-acetyltransferase [Bosea vaviloviae]AOO79924.1 GNAT family N-acetyltransferase [Bosea vaviloviae]
MVSAPEPLSEQHDLSTFDCGKPALDQWLRQRALSNHHKGFTAVMVIQSERRVIGYYGLAPTAITPTALSRSLRTGQPPDPVPCLLLGQLATDRRWSGQGIGTGLLKHAFGRCVQVAGLIGGRALLVRAIDDEARSFWLRRGFVPSNSDPMMLARSLQDIAVSVRSGARA